MTNLGAVTAENDTWELYDTRTDFSLANDLAVKNLEKLEELQIIKPSLEKTLDSAGQLKDVNTAVVAGLRL
jgi:hypothetical protein